MIQFWWGEATDEPGWCGQSAPGSRGRSPHRECTSYWWGEAADEPGGVDKVRPAREDARPTGTNVSLWWGEAPDEPGFAKCARLARTLAPPGPMFRFGGARLLTSRVVWTKCARLARTLAPPGPMFRLVGRGCGRAGFCKVRSARGDARPTGNDASYWWGEAADEP